MIGLWRLSDWNRSVSVRNMIDSILLRDFLCVGIAAALVNAQPCWSQGVTHARHDVRTVSRDPAFVVFSRVPGQTPQAMPSNVDWIDGKPLQLHADAFTGDGRLIDSVHWWGANLPASLDDRVVATSGPSGYACTPTSGDCCTANGTAGCQNVPCCETVCATDPHCCNTFWDETCRQRAQVECAVCDTGPNKYDGWLIGFHEPIEAGTLPAEALGVYYCDTVNVAEQPFQAPACDGVEGAEYQANLADCCLVHTRQDLRTGTQPAQWAGFMAEECVNYALSINTVIGQEWSTRSAGTVIGWWSAGEFYVDVSVDGGFAFLAGMSGQSNFIHVLDISDPAVPVLVTSYSLPTPHGAATPSRVAMYKGLLFVGLSGSGDAGLAIVDVRVPQAPLLLTTIEVPTFDEVSGFAYDGSRVYMADGVSPRFAVVDLSAFDPDDPPSKPYTSAQWLVGNVGGAGVHDVVVANGRLFASTSDLGVYAFDLSNVSTAPPALLGVSGGGGVRSAWPTGDGRFIVAAVDLPGGGIRVFEIEEHPTWVILILRDEAVLPNLSQGAEQVVVNGHRAYAAWNQAGLQVFDVDPANGMLSWLGGFDTSPWSGTGVREGSQGVFPFLGDDLLLISDTSEGLFAVDLTTPTVQCVAANTGRMANSATWGWLSAASAASSMETDATPMDDGGWVFGVWLDTNSTCGLAGQAFALSSNQGGGASCGCESVAECNDGNACTFDSCDGQSCSQVQRKYGDVDGNGTINLFDLFCVLNGFADDFANCALTNVDMEPCEGNDVINLLDLFAVLNAFGEADPCKCPAAP